MAAIYKTKETRKKTTKASDGGKASDPSMDFFNLGVSFKPQVIKTSKEQVNQYKKPTAPPMFSQDEDEEFFDCEESSEGIKVQRNEFKYAQPIKENEMNLYHILREEADQKELKRKSRKPSVFSEIEDNTIEFEDGPFSHGIHEDLQFKKYFDFSQRIKSDLPIANDREYLVELINREQVTVISGRTGSGKTTQVPQFILEDHAKRGKSVNIIVTQPRKIAAKSIAKRICDERGWEMGRLVGYKVGLDKENVSLDTRLLFCTTGVFKKMIIAKKNLNDWTHVILDEVHEREMDMDFVLLLCKRLINSNSRNVKLVLMSATIDTNLFQKYFSWHIPSADNKLEYCAEVYQMIESKSFSVREYYLDDLQRDNKFKLKVSAWPSNYDIDFPYINDECVQVASQIILERDDFERENGIKEKGAVLVFLPGEAEISRVKKYLEGVCKNNRKAWWILPLHSRIPFEETQNIFDHKKGYRKIILSTNVAESSLTIPDIYYVIDFCLQKLIMTDQYTNYVALKLQWADKNSCTQRKGRAGRVRSGLVFRLAPRYFYETFSDSGTAEMIRSPLEKVILDTKLLDFGAPKELLGLAMEPPKLRNIHKTTMRLKEIGALLTTSNGRVVLDDGDLTVLGEIIASLPVDISLGKLIVLGHIFNVLDECIIIAAGMSNNSLFSMPFGKKIKAYADKLCWADRSFSDCLAILVAYQTWYRKGKTGEFNRIPEAKWCKERHLQLKVLREMRQSIEEIKISLRRHHIDTMDLPNRHDRRQYNPDHMITSSEEDCLKLKVVIFGAFYPNYFVRTGLGLEEKAVYKEIYNNTTNSYHDPTSCVYFTNFDPQQAKYGVLYEDQIKNMFDGFDNRNIHVEFDGQKIIVQFTRGCCEKNFPMLNLNTQLASGSMANESFSLNCDILHEVYVAMKLRREPCEMMSLKLFNPDLAQQNMLVIQEKCNEFLNSPMQVVTAEAVGVRNPPSLEQKILHLEINYCNNPNSFWINFLSSECKGIENNMLQFLDAEIAQVIEERSLLKKVDNVNQVQIDQLFLAPYGKHFYRARIDRVIFSQNTVKVFFIDYGNIEIIPISQIYLIDLNLTMKFPSLVKTPALAHECSLAFTKPNPKRSEKGVWDEYSIKEFKELLELEKFQAPVTFVGKVLSVVPNSSVKSGHLIYLTLLKRYNNASIDGLEESGFKQSLNYQFQCRKDSDGKNLAVYTAESYLSALNNKLRASNNSFNATEKAEREKSQSDFIGVRKKDWLQESVVSSFLNESNRGYRDQRKLSVQLKGPHHPLQFNVVSTHRVGSCKKANVEPDSVNSVLLDKSANDRHDVWLVAGHVGTNSAGDTLVLRSTTLMPNKKGLGIILAMIFAPKVEMRYDSKMHEYTGCLLGLGYRKRGSGHTAGSLLTSKSVDGMDGDDWDDYWNDSVNGTRDFVPYHPVHDMEIQFDVNIDNDDLNLINQLRYRMSIALTRINERREDGSRLPLEQRMKEVPARLTIANLLIEDQDRIDSLVNQLLSKTRKVCNKKFFKREYHWRQLPRPDMLYHPHLKNEDELLLKMITQIKFPSELMKDLNLKS